MLLRGYHSSRFRASIHIHVHYYLCYNDPFFPFPTNPCAPSSKVVYMQAEAVLVPKGILHRGSAFPLPRPFTSLSQIHYE